MQSKTTLAALMAVMCLGTQAHSTTAIDAVTTRLTDKGLEVKIEGLNIPRPEETRSEDGKEYSLWIKAVLDQPVDLKVNKLGVEHVKSTRRSKWSSFLAFTIDPHSKPTLVETDSGWIVKFASISRTTTTAGVKKQKLAPSVTASPVGASPLATAKLTQTVAKLKLPVVRTPVKTSVLTTFTPVLVSKPKAISKPVDARLRVSLEFVNTDVVQILRALAMQTGVNIVAAPEVKGSLTVSLSDVDVEEALKMVTSMTELGYTRVGTTVLVAPSTKIEAIRRQITGEIAPAPAAPIDEAYMVRGGNAEDLVTAIAGKGQSILGKVSLLATPTGSSSRQTIVLRGPAEDVKLIKHTIEELDDADETVGSYQIYEVKHLDPRALREDLINAIPGLRASILPGAAANPGVYKPSEITKESQTQTAAAPGQGPQSGGANTDPSAQSGGGSSSSSSNNSNDVKSTADNRSDRDTMGLTQPFQAFEKIAVPMKIVLRGSQSQIDSALKYLAKIDLAPKQVALELRVMELTKDQALRVGLDWSVLNGSGTVQSIRVNQGLGDTAATSGVVSGTASGGISVTGTLDSIADSNNLIARPNLLAVDGRSAELFVGDVIRYIQTIQSSQNGTTVQTGEEHVGVRLAVMPRIGADGNIVMELRPIVSYLTGYTAVPGGGQLPQTSERIEQTTAVVHDGDTIALGGLIQTQDQNTVSGIPFLKDLPIIGQLFKRTDKNKKRTEVVFFLTVKIVKDNDKDRAVAADPRVDRKVPEVKH